MLLHGTYCYRIQMEIKYDDDDDDDDDKGITRKLCNIKYAL